MSNADQPAFSTSTHVRNHFTNKFEGGLTKRELIAAMVLQGLCAQPDTTMQGDVEASVKFADALLNELERTK